MLDNFFIWFVIVQLFIWQFLLLYQNGSMNQIAWSDLHIFLPHSKFLYNFVELILSYNSQLLLNLNLLQNNYKYTSLKCTFTDILVFLRKGGPWSVMWETWALSKVIVVSRLWKPLINVHVVASNSLVFSPPVFSQVVIPWLSTLSLTHPVDTMMFASQKVMGHKTSWLFTAE